MGQNTPARKAAKATSMSSSAIKASFFRMVFILILKAAATAGLMAELP
jgi:hypothetical protein